MEASVKLRLPALPAICKSEASLWVADAGERDDRQSRGHLDIARLSARDVQRSRRGLCANCACADWRPRHRHRPISDLFAFIDGSVLIQGVDPGVLIERQDGSRLAWGLSEFENGKFASIA
jgi:hypothetical protein